MRGIGSPIHLGYGGGSRTTHALRVHRVRYLNNFSRKWCTFEALVHFFDCPVPSTAVQDCSGASDPKPETIHSWPYHLPAILTQRGHKATGRESLEGGGGAPPSLLPTALTLPERHSHTPTPAPTAFLTPETAPPQPLSHPL